METVNFEYQHPLGLPEELYEVSFITRLAGRSVVLEQAGSVEKVSLVEDGVLKRAYLGPDGAQVILSLSFPGDIVGAPCALLGKPSPASVVCVTETRLRQIRSVDFRVREGGPSRWLQNAMCLEYASLVAHLIDVKMSSARTRTLAILERFAETGARESDGPTRISLPLRHWELAELVGVTPEHLSRRVKQLHREGVVVSKQGRLILYHRSKAG